MNKRMIVLAVIMVASAALARLAPHPPNVTPIAAMALLGGAAFTRRRLAYALPILAMLASDLVLAATRYDLARLVRSQPIVYLCILATTLLGSFIANRRSVWQVGGASLAGSLLFFVVTNCAVWAGGRLYPLTGTGLALCYAAAIPFFGNTLLGDLFFAGVLFGGLALLEDRVAWMRSETVEGAVP
jgi:hypothetical protein